MPKKIIKTREVMHEQHLEMDGMATVKEALDAMKAEAPLLHADLMTESLGPEDQGGHR